jgi:hypothetical protein
MRTTTTALLAAAALGASACATQEHLIQNYGDSNRGAFAAQRQRTSAEPAQPVTGLDAQEAAIISDTYRKSLAPKGQAVPQEPVMVLNPTGPDARYVPPPSVPKE